MPKLQGTQTGSVLGDDGRTIARGSGWWAGVLRQFGLRSAHAQLQSSWCEMSPQEEIRSNLPQIIEICRRYQVRELSLFGSALRSDFTQESDYDFLVEFQSGAKIGLFKFGRMVLDLETLFRRKIDLVFKSGLKPGLRDSVLEHAHVLYAQH